MPSLQVLTGFWMAYALLTQKAFTCNLRSYLVMKKHEAVADTFDDILEQERRVLYMDSPMLKKSFGQEEALIRKGHPYPPAPMLSASSQQMILKEGEHQTYSKYHRKNILVVETLGQQLS